MKSLTFVLLVAPMTGTFAVTTAAECCISLLGNGFCYDTDSGQAVSGGGIGNPTPTPVPPPRMWVSLPGAPGTFEDCSPECSPGDSGTPYHHDGLPGEHAVDIGAQQCTDSTCPLVSYFDNLNSTTATVVQIFDATCATAPPVPDGAVIVVELRSLNPAGVVQATAVYRHLRALNVNVGDTLSTATVLAQVDPDIMPSHCWSGPHLHQGIIAVGGCAVLCHLTGPGENCADSGTANSTIPCYRISW